jgi:hypothetical protein
MSLWYSFDRKMGGPQSLSGCGGKEKNIPSLSLPELNHGRPASSLVTILTELPLEVRASICVLLACNGIFSISIFQESFCSF